MMAAVFETGNGKVHVSYKTQDAICSQYVRVTSERGAIAVVVSKWEVPIIVYEGRSKLRACILDQFVQLNPPAV